MSKEDTNIIAATDLDFLKNIGQYDNVETTDTNEEDAGEHSNKDESSEEIVDDVIKEIERPVVNNVKNSIEYLLRNQTWSDVSLKFNDEEYESITDLLSKVEATDELFESLNEVQKKLQEDEIQSKYLKIEDTNPHNVKLAEAILKGAEYEDLLRYQGDVIDPLYNLDLNDDATAEEFVRHCLAEMSNLPQKYIDVEIKDLKQSLKLNEKAEEYKNIIKQDYEAELQRRTQEAIQAQQEEENRVKESIKNFRKTLKEDSFSPTFIDKATQLRYNVDNDGEEHYLKLIKDKVKDKDFEKKLIHLLLDEEDFYKKVKAPVKQEATKKVFEIINVIPNKSGASPTRGNSVNLTEADANFMDLINKT